MAVPRLAEDHSPERLLAIDDEDNLLRVTWRRTVGVMNLSIWRDDSCVATFHLSPAEAGRLTAFLATTLASAVPEPSGSGLRLVPETPQADRTRRDPGWKDRVHRVIQGIRDIARPRRSD